MTLSRSKGQSILLRIGRWKCATTKYRRDEGRSLGVGLQELAPNHRKLL